MLLKHLYDLRAQPYVFSLFEYLLGNGTVNTTVHTVICCYIL